MLLDTSGISLLGNLLTGKGTIRSGEGIIRADQNFNKCLNYKNIIKMNLNLMVYIPEIIYLE